MKAALPIDRVINVGYHGIAPCADLRDERYAEALSGPVVVRQMTPEEREKYGDPVPAKKIVELAAKGMLAREIAAELSVQTVTVRHVLLAAVRRGDLVHAGPGRYRAPTERERKAHTEMDRTRNTVLNLVVSGGMTRFAIAQAVGLTEAQVDGILAKAVKLGQIERLRNGKYRWADIREEPEETEVADVATQDEAATKTEEQQPEPEREVPEFPEEWTRGQRAISLVVDHGWSQSDAASYCGITQGGLGSLLRTAVEAGEIEKVAYGNYRRKQPAEGNQRKEDNAVSSGVSEDRVREIVTEAIQPLARQLDAIAGELRRLSENQSVAVPQPGVVMSQITLRLLDVLEAQAGNGRQA